MFDFVWKRLPHPGCVHGCAGEHRKPALKGKKTILGPTFLAGMRKDVDSKAAWSRRHPGECTPRVLISCRSPLEAFAADLTDVSLPGASGGVRSMLRLVVCQAVRQSYARVVRTRGSGSCVSALKGEAASGNGVGKCSAATSHSSAIQKHPHSVHTWKDRAYAGQSLSPAGIHV